jgi:hypothetical protein
MAARRERHKRDATAVRAGITRRQQTPVIKLFMLRPTVFAYLDPGTGSMIVQLLVGGVAAVAVTAKLYWHRILRLLRIRKDEPELDQER